MVKINCKETFRIPKYVLSKTGMWPKVNATKYELLSFIFTLISATFLVSFSILLIINEIKTGNIVKLSNWLTCLLIPAAAYAAKMYTLIMNKKCFHLMLSDINSYIFNSHSDNLNEAIQLICRISKVLMRYFTFGLATYLTLRSFLPIIVDVGLILPAPWNMGRYDILYRIFHFLATVNICMNSAGFDVLFLTLMAVCVAQLHILEKRLRNVFEDAVKCSKTKESVNLVINLSLKECVVLHETINQAVTAIWANMIMTIVLHAMDTIMPKTVQNVIGKFLNVAVSGYPRTVQEKLYAVLKYVRKLSILLGLPLFVQYIGGCFIICNVILQLTIWGESNSTNIAGLCTYFGITFSQLTAFHWLGNEIIFKSNKIIELSYLSKWYELDVKSRKTLILLMERAKRPLMLQLYGFIFISLDSMGVIIRWAYSVFAVIKARYN